MEPTRRPEDEVQLNKTPAEQEEPEYSLEEIMNEFGGWTKREEQAAEPGETVRLASPAGRAPDAPCVRGGRGACRHHPLCARPHKDRV